MSRVGCFANCPLRSYIRKLFLLVLLLSLPPCSEYLIDHKLLMSSSPLISCPVLTFPAISVSSINCNSLNVSTITSYHQKLKIHGITKLNSDFIILSDIRLGKKGHIKDEIEKMFLTNPYCSYKFISSSSTSSRGVGILIKTNLNVSALAEAPDNNENILAIRVQLLGTEFVICAIYGPNSVCPDFFNDLNNVLNTVKNVPLVVGGDWNCTPSTCPINTNPDVINMTKLPNLSHSNLLHSLMTKYNLVDLYRCYFPHRKDFTFIPKCREQKNRSRIDFILISESIVNFSHNCDIAPSVPNSLFDHKSTFVNFLKKKVPSQRTAISAAILKDPIVDLLVQTSAIECYLHHMTINPGIKHEKLQIIGVIRSLIKDAGPDPVLNNTIGWDDAKELNRANTINEILLLLDNFDLSLLESSDLNIDNDVFLEYYVNCIRNDVASFQIFCSKTTSEAKNKLILELSKLKNVDDLNIDHTVIAEKEQKLNAILDRELKNEFEKFRHYDLLNSEKITPSFLRILRGSGAGAKLSDILDDEGKSFSTEIDREKYIVEFFKKIYKKPITEKQSLSGCIEQFLGPYILDHPVVKDSILTAGEKTKLEEEFSISELDCAIKDANMNSAAGIDGLSTKFIAKFWNIFRVPLFKYANCCFRKGILTNTFKSATIRLIPKKGNVTQIKNWRPISLLSNLYKVLSRAINNRLLTTTDRVTSRAQKGFTKSRYLQEVLINVMEFIGNCDAAGVNAFVLSIDYAKAFDTLSIKFMTECYKFFGFGNYFINMLETVGNSRTASIILDDGSYSEQFILETGRPQGENLSPGQYNIANQIMLFRLELDPRIKSVFQHFLVPKWNFDPPGINKIENRKFRYESNRQTENTEGFADDTTTLGKLSTENISFIGEILEEFASFSGLRCNYEKTLLVPVGKIARAG